VGINAKIIDVVAVVNVGFHKFNIVGLADRALNEAKERVNSALKNIGVKPPNRENRTITINLAPADIKKTGSQYDLSIALGYLLATQQISQFKSEEIIFLGELALDGRLRPIIGALNIAEAAARKKFKYLLLPQENANEAAAIKGIEIIPLLNLKEVIAFLEGRKNISPKLFIEENSERISVPDFSEIRGQESAKRALTIAAAGEHNILMTGPPGVGKSFLARAFSGIMPRLERDEAIEITKIWSSAGMGYFHGRPFRSPHQTASLRALVGGGSDPHPGEISLAHRGVLFLDELPEFQGNVLEALRGPMETGFVHIARARQSFVFPARFILVAAMNPCPCGYLGDPEIACKCTPFEVIRYDKKISGPLIDRIDIQIKLGRITIEKLREKTIKTSVTQKIRNAVEQARERQRVRFSNENRTNATMTAKEIGEMLNLDDSAEKFLSAASGERTSPRMYHRLLKVARTIADLEEKENVSGEHLAEAFSYRLKGDR